MQTVWIVDWRSAADFDCHLEEGQTADSIADLAYPTSSVLASLTDIDKLLSIASEEWLEVYREDGDDELSNADNYEWRQVTKEPDTVVYEYVNRTHDRIEGVLVARRVELY